MPDFRITYRDKTAHVIGADKYGPHGEYFVFTRDGRDIASIPRSEVFSVVSAEVPEPEEVPDLA